MILKFEEFLKEAALSENAASGKVVIYTEGNVRHEVDADEIVTDEKGEYIVLHPYKVEGGAGEKAYIVKKDGE